MIVNRIIAWAEQRKPDLVLGDDGNGWIYLTRWFAIPQNPLFNIYVHKMQADTEGRAMHDHPWVNISILLRGGYFEHTTGRILGRIAGDIVFRRAKSRHRLEVLKGHTCWTLFITGPRFRKWGFYCPQGWRFWKDYVNLKDPGKPGPGCE